LKKSLLISLLVSLFFSFSDTLDNEIGLHSHSHSHILSSAVHEHTHIDSTTTFFYSSKEEKDFELIYKSTYAYLDTNIPNPIKNGIFRPPIS
jgi:hypothetical protein